MRTFFAAVLVLWLPGRAIIELINCFDRCNKTGITTSLGLSLAATPLATLLFSSVGVKISAKTLTGTCIVCASIILLGSLRRQLICPINHKTTLEHWQAALVPALIFSATLILRFIQIQNLALPLWVDSLHHTLIIQIIQEQGQLPSQIMAYNPIPFYYHFGFHTLAAVFGKLADLSAPQAILVLGQILNAMVVLSIYHFAIELTQRRYVGYAAAALTGFVSQMPAYYASWGRYTLLTGMTLLPIAMAEAVKIWQSPLQISQGLMLAFLTAGIVLTHYLAAAYHFFFLVAIVLVNVIDKRYSQKGKKIISVSTWSSLGLLFITPWIVKALPRITSFVHFQTMIPDFYNSGVLIDRLQYLWHLANHTRSWIILVIALPEAIISFTHHTPSRLLTTWVTILLALSNEILFQIQPFRADLLLICLFLPMNVLASASLSRLRQLIPHIINSHLVKSIASISILITLSLWGFSDTLSIINPTTVLADPADVKALNWIDKNVAPNAKFLINAKPWQYNMYRGTDGGWWIPIFSQCKTVLPPGIFYGWGDHQYIQEVKETAERVMEVDGCNPNFWKVVQDTNITHIYIGSQGGKLQPIWFDRCPGVRRIYLGRKVHIYEIDTERAQDVTYTIRKTP